MTSPLDNYDWERLLGLGYTQDFIERMKDDPCWKGFAMAGMKKKGGRSVPNCVPLDSKHSENPMDDMAIGNAFEKEPGETPKETKMSEAKMLMPRDNVLKKENAKNKTLPMRASSNEQGYAEWNPTQSEEPNGGMAVTQLKAMCAKVEDVLSRIDENSNLEPWCASKIATASDSIDAIANFIVYGRM